MYGGDAIRDPPLRSPDSLIRETVSEYHSEDGTAISEHGLESEARDVAADATTDTNLVGWDGPDDPENPQNWSVKYKWIVTGICILMTVNVYVSISPFLHVVNDGMVSRTFASSAPSMATPNIIQEFGISREVSDLTTTTFLLGYVFGVCTSPLSISFILLIPQLAIVLGTRFRSHRPQTYFHICAHPVYPLPPWPKSSPEHRNPSRDSFLVRFLRSGTTDKQRWCHCGYLVFCW